ncbi:shikimate kinase [Salana multivorans]|uniref:Shikimate kinase n=1 Tax=Salana multivorans TaxID=120377 RepID=A0A3N2D1B0_9MICO|nr:shikimate kinase [Salana multivorans]MBN8880936.1 shikimate kinase [Salana multivorans]OJX94325.1 MAG: hypothetical protein BGO96_15605 [Micrococcales bacterium 73-15]ROR93547.1 shikimate kinase [Salana multivorans]
MRPTLVLCGPMGSGKSAVGRRAATALGVAIHDTDAMIEERAGRTIAEIFAADGEPAFREIERDVVVEALGTTAGVLALGGGAVLHPDTRRALAGYRADGGVVVFLDVSARQALLRIGTDQRRPMLHGDGESPRQRWNRIAAERRAVYEEVASHVVTTDRGTPAAVARRILALLPDA